MSGNQNCAGICVYEDIKLQYSITHLEFIKGRYLHIEAVCYNPSFPGNNEAVFKFTTKRFNFADEKFKLALALLNSVIDILELPQDLLKLTVKNKQVFFMHEI